MPKAAKEPRSSGSVLVDSLTLYAKLVDRVLEDVVIRFQVYLWIYTCLSFIKLSRGVEDFAPVHD